jgi:hypothetical protein
MHKPTSRIKFVILSNSSFTAFMPKKQIYAESELAALAKAFREKSGKRKADIARELELGAPTIQHAEEYPEMSLTKVRKRIIETCSPYELVGPVFFLKRARHRKSP